MGSFIATTVHEPEIFSAYEGIPDKIIEYPYLQLLVGYYLVISCHSLLLPGELLAETGILKG
ncbi:MAG: hypothetical protein MZV63_70000 [Marinilabiliales bacterium]|nr:hypothetical protein [Marinilabiliales bacterium]